MSPTLPQSRPTESQFKTSSKLKMLGPLCNQTVNLKTESKNLCYSILKLKYSPSILKQNNSQNNWHSNYTNRMFLQKHMFRSIDRRLLPTERMPWIILLLWGFIWDGDAGRRGNKITELSTAIAGLVEGHRIDREDLSNAMSDRNVWNKIAQSIPTERAE